VYLKNTATRPAGSFNLVNNYRTLEFTPSTMCGTNNCGNPIYCLPCKIINGKCDQRTPYQIILRSPSTTGNGFESVIGQPGIRDTAGNALDGDKDNAVDGSVFSTPVVFPSQPDHYYWQFNLEDRIDKTQPYIERISPTLNQEFVRASAIFEILFTKPMRVQSLYDGIGIEEKPTPSERGDNEPIGFVPTISVFNDGGLRDVFVQHEPFLEGRSQFYYPILTSKLEDSHFNCFYPGKGPGGGNDLTTQTIGTCYGINCCNATSSPANLDLCCNGVVGGQESPTSPFYNTTSSCVGRLKDLSIIPGQE
jgi:hypothetical protein